MTTSERAELLDIIDRTFTGKGGRATKADMQLAVMNRLPQHLRDYFARRGVSSCIGEYFRQQGDDGLPQAPQVDDGGTHVQLELLSVDEIRYLVASYVHRADSNLAQAAKLIKRCKAIHGVTIDIDNPIEGAA